MRPFLLGFSDELAKLAAPPANALPASAGYHAAIPRQAIPSGAAPAPSAAFRPALPTGPAYQSPQPAAPAAAKKSGGNRPVGSAWLQMADRAPTETTGKFVNRQYGVPERQMGVNQGQVFPDANDAKVPQRMRTLAGSVPIDESRAPALRVPQVKDTSKLNVPGYLQRAVGGINQKPTPYLMPGETGSHTFVGGAVGFGDPRAPRLPRPTSATTTAPPEQPAQAGL